MNYCGWNGAKQSPPTSCRASVDCWNECWQTSGKFRPYRNHLFIIRYVLEPSCGVGNFMGLVPDSMEKIRMYGVELDSISGRIAQQLYQKNKIAVQGFETMQFPDSFFDCVVGNVPFGNYKVPDKRYDRHNFLIHDYFIAKSLDLVRPGGVVAVVTSSGTMDKKDSSVREYLANRADDAIEAGFNHVVFIIRKDIEKEFKEVIGDRIASICASHDVTVDYAFQDINDIPGELPEGRTKPWGTGQAVLAAKKVIKIPFIVINADDYYGKEGFKAVHEYLVNGGKSCMAGFVLKNTLSDNGGVTRGICKMDENGNLTEVVETKNIVKTAAGAEADGVVVDVNSLVSMNMWGLTPDFLDVLENGFKEFFEKEVPSNPQKAEYLIPIFIGELLEQGKMSVKVLKTNDTWYGMTYHEDVAAVKNSFKKMLADGVYKADLFSDL